MVSYYYATICAPLSAGAGPSACAPSLHVAWGRTERNKGNRKRKTRRRKLNFNSFCDVLRMCVNTHILADAREAAWPFMHIGREGGGSGGLRIFHERHSVRGSSSERMFPCKMGVFHGNIRVQGTGGVPSLVHTHTHMYTYMCALSTMCSGGRRVCVSSRNFRAFPPLIVVPSAQSRYPPASQGVQASFFRTTTWRQCHVVKVRYVYM